MWRHRVSRSGYAPAWVERRRPARLRLLPRHRHRDLPLRPRRGPAGQAAPLHRFQGVKAPGYAELARQVLEALSRGDVPGFTALVHPEIEIHTARDVYRGADAAEEWARKRYEHLERHFAIDRLEARADEVTARVRTQYVWRESGLVGDEEPMTIHLAFADGRLVRWKYGEA